MFQVTPEKKTSKLDKLVGQPVLAADMDLGAGEQGTVRRNGSGVARGLVRSVVTAYLDTQVVVWLCEDNLKRLSNAALDAINDHDLLISPAVLIELNFLYQIKRLIRAPQDLAKTASHADWCESVRPVVLGSGRNSAVRDVDARSVRPDDRVTRQGE